MKKNFMFTVFTFRPFVFKPEKHIMSFTDEDFLDDYERFKNCKGDRSKYVDEAFIDLFIQDMINNNDRFLIGTQTEKCKTTVWMFMSCDDKKIFINVENRIVDYIKEHRCWNNIFTIK